MDDLIDTPVKIKGQAGGLAVYAKYGSDHMREIGKKGAETFWNKYTLQPIGINEFAIVDRKTNQIVATR